MGIEPTSTAWEAVVLPMNYIRITSVSILADSFRDVKPNVSCFRKEREQGVLKNDGSRSSADMG